MLRQPEKNISYRALPPLPWELAETMLVGVGSKLYSIGGRLPESGINADPRGGGGGGWDAGPRRWWVYCAGRNSAFGNGLLARVQP